MKTHLSHFTGNQNFLDFKTVSGQKNWSFSVFLLIYVDLLPRVAKRTAALKWF